MSMKPLLFQTDQINCSCFSTSPKDKPKIFLTKNQSLTLKERSEYQKYQKYQSVKKQHKFKQTLRNQSQPSKNKKKSLKKEKPSNISQTSRNLIQQNNELRSNKNQQKEKQFLSNIPNLQSRRHSQNEREYQRIFLNGNQFGESKVQNYKNFQTLHQNIQNINQTFDLKLNNNINHIQQKQKHGRNFRQPHLNQINPFHQLQQFHLMELNKKKSIQKQKSEIQKQRQRQRIKQRAFSSRQMANHRILLQDEKNRNQPVLSSIQWRNTNKANQSFNDKSILMIPTKTTQNQNFSFINIHNNVQVPVDSHQPIWSQRKEFHMNIISTRANFELDGLKTYNQQQNTLYNHIIPSIDNRVINSHQLNINLSQKSQHHNNSIQKQLIKNHSKNSTRKQSINSKHRENKNHHPNPNHVHQQNSDPRSRRAQIQMIQQHNNINSDDKIQNGIHFHFENIPSQNNYHNHNHNQQFCPSPVRTLNSFRGSKVSYKEKQSITKKLHEKRMLPKQIQSVNDQNQDNMSQISEVLGRGWENYDTQNENIEGEDLQAIKNRKEFKTLTLFTRQSELNSKTNTKASQIKTGTQHSLFLSPKSQQVINMHQFPLNNQGIGAYDLSYKNIGNLSQIKNKQSLMNKYNQAQKSLEHSLQKDEHSANKNKKSRKSSLKHI